MNTGHTLSQYPSSLKFTPMPAFMGHRFIVLIILGGHAGVQLVFDMSVSLSFYTSVPSDIAELTLPVYLIAQYQKL